MKPLHIIILAIGCVALGFILGLSVNTTTTQDTSSENIQKAPEIENRQVAAPIQSDIFDYTTWEYYVTDRIDEYNTAPAGYNYYVVTIHIDNKGTNTYDTNPWSWTLTANGITYYHDSVTYDDAINTKTVDVGPGGKTDVQYVYLVEGEPTEIFLNYNY